jgi:hypothetical protein
MGKIQTKYSHGSRGVNQMSSAERRQHPGSNPGRNDVVSPLHRAILVPGSPPRGTRCRNVKLSTHLYVKSRVRIRGSLPPFPMHFQGAGLN